MSDTMRVVEISQSGGPEVLKLGEREIPAPGHGQVLLKIAYSGVNRPDALQRAGMYAPPPEASDLPGLEAAGEIAAVGPGVDDLKVGDEVCALLPGGGYAEYAVTPAAHCLPRSQGDGPKLAACLPETYFTVWSNVFQRGGLQAGEKVPGAMAARRGSARRRSSSPGTSARGSSRPPDRPRNVPNVRNSARNVRSITAKRTSSRS